MKTNQLLLIVLLTIGCSFKGFAQAELKFEINKALPFISISESKLAQINTLSDLDKRYPASWVKEYISVEVSAYQNGIKTMASGKSDVLNRAQKALIQSADRTHDLEVNIMYIPNNTLKNNPAKLYDFKLTIMPDQDAMYAGGKDQLLQYLQENGIANIEPTSFTGFDLTAIKFTITEQGRVSDIQVAMPSKDSKIDDILVAAIAKMSVWTPATFSNGVKVKQNYVLTIGNMESCMVNLLHIRPIE